MDLLNVEVKKLFGKFDYVVPLSGDKFENYLIITAPNGFGKSTILRIINSFFNRKYDFFLDLKFEEIVLEFSNNFHVTISKNKNSKLREVVFLSSENNRFVYSKRRFFEHKERRALEYITKNVYTIERIGIREWLDREDGQIYTLKELMDKYDVYNILGIEKESNKVWLDVITSKLKVDFIETNRLFEINGEEYEYNVDVLSYKIKELINKSINEHFIVSKEQESTFAKRVLENLNTNVSIGILDIERKLKALDDFNKTYNENKIFGSIDLDDNIVSKIKESSVSENIALLWFLNEYISDVYNKVKRFENLGKKIKLFQSTINHLFYFKKVEINPDYGIKVINDSKDRIKLNDLSSGEQHMLIMVGKLIFESDNNNIILLDEPEISLHASWQQQILNLINELTATNKTKVVIATHSFTLINGHWDNSIELAEFVK